MTGSAASSSEPATGEQSGQTPRLATLDILRGLAVLGMILAHCHKFLGDAVTNWSLNPIGWLITAFVAEKDRVLFALLFGIGFAVMLRQLERKALPVTLIYTRRLVTLYLIGFVVEALTRFHILREYAWWGLVLLFLRDLPTRTLLLFAVLSAAAFSLRDIVDDTYLLATEESAVVIARERVQLQAWEALRQTEETALASPYYLAVVQTRVQHMAKHFFSLQNFTPNYYLALFIAGLLAVRHGIVERPWAHRRLLAIALVFGAFCWIADWYYLSKLPADLITPRLGLRLQSGLGLIEEHFLAISYVALGLVLLAHHPLRQRVLGIFAWVGRMALTNYIIHAIVIDLIAASYGLSLTLPPFLQLAVALTLFVFLAGFSFMWLRVFRYGPVEWLWRCATYWTPQKLRR